MMVKKLDQDSYEKGYQNGYSNGYSDGKFHTKTHILDKFSMSFKEKFMVLGFTEEIDEIAFDEFIKTMKTVVDEEERFSFCPLCGQAIYWRKNSEA